MTDAPDDRRAAELRGIIADAEALQALSRTRPHAWAEGKDSLVRRLRDFYNDLRDGGAAAPARSPDRTTVFQPGLLARRGRLIPVERRQTR